MSAVCPPGIPATPKATKRNGGTTMELLLLLLVPSIVILFPSSCVRSCIFIAIAAILASHTEWEKRPSAVRNTAAAAVFFGDGRS